MFPGFVAPLLIALALAAAVTTTHRRFPPILAARMVMVTVVVVAAAALPTLWMLVLAYTAHVRVFGMAWCTSPMTGQRVPAWIGIPSLIIATAGTWRAAKVIRSHRRLRCDVPGPVEVADHDDPFAFTLPGRAGHVLISRGMLELLEPDERAVVLAHENAHGRHRHDRYLFVAQLAASLVPPLRPLSTRLHFTLERWADEAAVAHCGDRHFVARTLGKVALATAAPIGALSFTGLGTPARVAALLANPTAQPRLAHRVGLWSAIAVAGVFSIVQVHHLVGLVSTLCPY